MGELQKQLRAGADIELDAVLQVGAAGEIDLKSENQAGLRKKKVNKDDSTLLQGLDIDEDSDKSVAEQLRDALKKNAVRVVDLFREWDDDGSGVVTRPEFDKAMPMLGFDGPMQVVVDVIPRYVSDK